MAESYGFFDAMLDSTSGTYDRIYLAEQFASYFKLFVTNGVFKGDNNNALLVQTVGSGLNIKINPGWCFINGYWYYNDSEKVLQLSSNSTSYDRTDSIRIRFSQVSRTITSIIVSGTDLTRSANTYDLEIAQVVVRANATVIVSSDITDKRNDSNRCGIIANTLTIQSEINKIIDGTTTVGRSLSSNKVNDEIILSNKSLLFSESGDAYTSRLNITGCTSNSLVDVYFDSDSYNEAMLAEIVVDSYNGYIILTANNMPSKNLIASVKVKVV